MNVTKAHSIVVEFLSKNGFLETSETYQNELTEREIFVSDPPPIPLSIKLVEENEVDGEVFIKNFQNGNSRMFWKLWSEYVMSKENDDEDIIDETHDIQKLEFSLHLYFAVFYMIGNDRSSPVESSMQEFKNYLETKGALLSQTPEFVAYYALPFVPNPKSHPTFKVIFEDEWRVKLNSELDALLGKLFKTNTNDNSASETYLAWLLTEFNNQQDNSSLKNEKREIELEAKINVLTHDAKESEFRAKHCVLKLNRLKEDYHNLIGISAELVDSLEQCIRGNMVTPEYLVNICERLFKKSEKVDLSKPGTTADIMRESLSSEYVLDSYLPDANDTDLNYVRIKSDLSGQCSDRKKGLLLQALIWRLLKSTQDDRDKQITSFLSADIFGCKNNIVCSHIKTIFESNYVIAAEYLARFINTVASFALGRIHVSQSKTFVSYLVEVMIQMEQDNLTSENLLGALQKLSLRKSVQDTLIELSVIEWLLQRLKTPEILSEYGLEYMVALLMNLCLRTIGKKRCVDRAEYTLEILMNLLSYGSYDIQPYINGTLYSILALPSIRKAAIQIGLETMLNLYKDDDDQNNRQISFIVKQLYKGDDSISNDDVESDEEEEEDEEGDAVETEMEKEESLFARDNEMEGEALLKNKYLMGHNTLSVNASFTKKSYSKQKDEPLTRPVTPASKPNRTQKKKSPRNLVSESSPRNRVSESSPRNRVSESKQATPQVLMERPRTQSGKKNRNPPKEQAKPSKKNYKQAFASRPKVPRTPELSDSEGTIIFNSQTPPPVTRSISPTRPLTGKSLPSDR